MNKGGGVRPSTFTHNNSLKNDMGEGERGRRRRSRGNRGGRKRGIGGFDGRDGAGGAGGGEKDGGFVLVNSFLDMLPAFSLWVERKRKERKKGEGE